MLLLLFLIATLVSCDTAWVSVLTEQEIDWAGTDDFSNVLSPWISIVFCFSDDDLESFKCCDPDREGIDDYYPGLEQAWTFTDEGIDASMHFFLCNMQDDAWLFDAQLNVDGTWFQDASYACVSSDDNDCVDVGISGGNCVHWGDGGYYSVESYPVDPLILEDATDQYCVNYEDVTTPPEAEDCDIYNDPDCLNYEGGYVAGATQVGFDDEQFLGDYEEDIVTIDEVLEDMETDFENEALDWEIDVYNLFVDKENAYLDVTAAEQTYQDRLNDRLAEEGAYNIARDDEEVAHADLLTKIDIYNAAVQSYIDKHEDYVEKVDFLNYELFIIQQIRELLGEEIGYIPEQVIIEVVPYNPLYDGWSTVYPEIHTSTFDHEEQRFKRRKRKRSTKKRRTKKRQPKDIGGSNNQAGGTNPKNVKKKRSSRRRRR